MLQACGRSFKVNKFARLSTDSTSSGFLKSAKFHQEMDQNRLQRLELVASHFLLLDEFLNSDPECHNHYLLVKDNGVEANRSGPVGSDALEYGLGDDSIGPWTPVLLIVKAHKMYTHTPRCAKNFQRKMLQNVLSKDLFKTLKVVAVKIISCTYK
jgi:hypothetical protein